MFDWSSSLYPIIDFKFGFTYLPNYWSYYICIIIIPNILLSSILLVWPSSFISDLWISTFSSTHFILELAKNNISSLYNSL